MREYKNLEDRRISCNYAVQRKIQDKIRSVAEKTKTTESRVVNSILARALKIPE